ncbi:MAG: aminotransferase class V-fold PLP-dependent enzyme, partial [Spirochaetia bacterium]|nr:aminotransferase class V-fold PLP-dependent enzyme [Spirochaetia bacterium]
MIYLDHASTSPVLPEVRDEIISAMDRVSGNPSNLHRAGQEAARLLRTSRTRIAECLDVLPTEILFCSCGTEANNWVLESTAVIHPDLDLLALSTMEHASVHFKAESLRGRVKEVDFYPVNEEGVLDLSGLSEKLRGKKTFFSLLAVNNETGVVQPLEEVRAFANGNALILHSDATQALGKIPFQPSKLGLDFATFSGHKIGAPKGIGFLFKKQSAAFSTLLHGGTQALGSRGGTDNLPDIAGLAQAGE